MFRNNVMRGSLLSLVLALAMGCGQATKDKLTEMAIEKAAESASGSEKVDIQMKDGKVTAIETQGEGENMRMTMSETGGTMNVSAESGGMVMTMGDDAKIPAEFPKDFPVYAGLKLSMAHSDSASGTFMVQGATPDALDKVAEFYVKGMKDNGWTETMNMTQPEMRNLTYTKDTRSANVTLSKKDAGADVMLTLGPQ